MQTQYNQNIIYGSLTRIADLQERQFTINRAPRRHWSTGDYVVGRYVGHSEGKCGGNIDYLELHDGNLKPLKVNDLVVGALGIRQDTQKVVGTWKLIEESKHPEMVDICGSGMFGITWSFSSLEPYCGIEALREILGSDKRPSRVFVVLCASDAYSVSGLRQALVFWCEAITLCIWNHLSFRCSIIVMSVCGGCGPNAVQARILRRGGASITPSNPADEPYGCVYTKTLVVYMNPRCMDPRCQNKHNDICTCFM